MSRNCRESDWQYFSVMALHTMVKVEVLLLLGEGGYPAGFGPRDQRLTVCQQNKFKEKKLCQPSNSSREEAINKTGLT